MWDKIEHNGYEVWVLPILAYGPPSPATLWHYSAYICRHGAHAHVTGQSIRFEELVATFRSEEEAREAGYVEGKRRVDMIPEGGWGAGNG
ncbi:hypothetical protein B0G76_3054 [Paraburkholderia sp. BL23I1N1]|uniref:hypothetical protein n=1 Tax=Paraburkholderia sp. BL23I1N1 TaxID=1938802 RepID=UPI000E762209|nr:hypothetical protein [Paraburkholderia sp. BL23I1N1]RKE36841.1 hypothetical protein B0G76_3054 [Paraburkholderia sp. BL23I1N1]